MIKDESSNAAGVLMVPVHVITRLDADSPKNLV